MRKIVTVTMNPSLDKSAHIDRLKNDTKLHCHSVRMDPGGGGLNVSRALKKLGGESMAILPSGGFEGNMLLEQLKEADIVHRAVQIKASIRENLTILEDQTEHQYRFGMPGPEISPTERNLILEVIDSELEDNSILVVSGSLPESVPLDFYDKLGRFAESKNVLFFADASGSQLKAAIDTNRLF